MARKQVWDTDTLRRELAMAWNDLESIPKRHVARIQRISRLMVYMQRHYLADRLAAVAEKEGEQSKAVAAESRGKIEAFGELDLAMTSILEDSFERQDEESGFDVQYPDRYNENMKEVYRDTFYDE